MKDPKQSKTNKTAKVATVAQKKRGYERIDWLKQSQLISLTQD